MSETREPFDESTPEGLNESLICVHDIVPENVPLPKSIMSAMKLRVIGHVFGETDKDDELFVLVMSAPNAAIFASRILEEGTKSDELTQIMTAMVLSREVEEMTKRNQPSEADPLAELSKLFGDSVPLDGETEAGPKGYARNATIDDPIRLLDLGTNPDGRPTVAPIDNRNEYPEGMNGYL